jgi:hypothetical protein
MKTRKFSIALAGVLAVAGSAFGAESGLDAYHRVFQGEASASNYEGSGQVPAPSSSSTTADAHAAYARVFPGEGNASITEGVGKTTPGIWSNTTADAHAAYYRAFPGEGNASVAEYRKVVPGTSTATLSSNASDAIAASTLRDDHLTN